MPPVTKGQSGQVHDDRSLSVPQLSASATADGFGMALKANGIVIDLKTKLLIVGDSVMGCFSKRREMVTHFPARFIYWLLRSVFG